MRVLVGLCVAVLCVIALAWQLSPSAAASTINVPADYPTIQGAIDAAVNGDTVVVAPGTYFENVNFNGKAIELRSADGPEVTAIDANFSGSVVQFLSSEGPSSILRGFTIRNGRADYFGGGIRVFLASPTIVGNVVVDNAACSQGGGIYAVGSPLLEGNVVSGNGTGCSGGQGGGLYLGSAGAAVVKENEISGNLASFGGGIVLNGLVRFENNVVHGNGASQGGGMYLEVARGVTAVQNLFYDNIAFVGSAVFSTNQSVPGSGPVFVSNTIVGGALNAPNELMYLFNYDGTMRFENNLIVADVGAALTCNSSHPPPVFRSNNVFAVSGPALSATCAYPLGMNGNISVDPQFADRSANDFNLRPDSPSVDHGDNTVPELPAMDLESGPRIVDGDFDSLPVIDQGALEFDPGPAITKSAEGNANNVDPSVPAANLWLCIAPAACAGEGEGSLRVVERALNVGTGDENGDTVADGLGAYEFQVEYDNFVIQSVNPCDLVFGPGGAGAARGPVDEADASSPANADCAPDPGGASNGTCAMSLILENAVRFGCVTGGAAPAGPNGTFDLASLELVPHPDLVNDIFPGNENGVLTVIKDNGCELVDVFGHAVEGSVNGGLTPVCGDLAVTVRILEGDLDLDCDVDVTDAQLISFRYGSFFGSLLYSKWFDLEPALHDLDIDVKDLQKVFGRDGSTCQDPVPAQPPLGPPVPFG